MQFDAISVKKATGWMIQMRSVNCAGSQYCGCFTFELTTIEASPFPVLIGKIHSPGYVATTSLPLIETA